MAALISTKGRYALRAMVDLAQNKDAGLVPLADIARRQGISEKYLESIVSALSKAGFISGQRGKGGGYKLTRDPADYSLGEIVRLVEGRIQPVKCLEECNSRCVQRDSCKTLTMWEELDHMINSFFDGKTLEDLVDGGGPLMSDWPSYL